MAFPDSDLQVVVKAYLGADPTTAVGTWPAATDLSSRLLDVPMQGSQGRGQGQATANSGSLTFTLQNDDGALTPLLATSPYYGDWDLGCPMSVEVSGVGASPPYGLMRGYIASLEQTVVPLVGGGVSSAVKVTLGGVIRQQSQGKVAKSSQRRYYENVSPQPVAYWPLESGDGRGVFSFQSGLAGGATLNVIETTSFGVTRPFAAAGGISPGPQGAASATDTSAGGRLSAAVPVVQGATTARGEFSMLANGYENTFPGIMSLYTGTTASDGSATRIGVAAQDLGSGWQIGVLWIGPAGASQLYAPGVFLLQDNQWHLVQFDLSSSGGGADTAYVLRVDGVTVLSGTATGYAWLPVTKVDTNTLATDIDRQAHLAVWSGTSLPTASDSYEAFLGHAGERAHTRVARVCTEDGIPFTTTATTSQACGPQPVGTVLDIVQDAETVDRGVLYELLTDWGLGYVAASQRYNVAAALTVDLSTYRTSDDGVSVVTPVRNDARLRNAWTVSMPAGGDVTVADTANIAKRGYYTDSAEVNVSAAAAMLHEASWRVHEGTYDGPRYRSLPLDLAANSASPTDLLTPWLAMKLGDRIDRIHNPALAYPYDDTHLVLLGYSHTIGRRSWDVSAVVEPYDPWQVQQLANASPDLSSFVGRAASDPNCAIRSDITTSTTSIPFDPNFFRWTTTAAHFNTANWPAMQVRTVKAPGIAGGGELLTVSAISTTAATYVAAGAASHADNAAVTPALYTGHAQGDWVCVLARMRGTAGTLATPTGYTLLAQQGLLYLWARVRGASSPGNPTVTPSGGSAGDTVSAVTFGLRNMPTTLSLGSYVLASAKQTNGSAQNIAYPGRAPAVVHPGVVQLLLGGKSDDDTGIAPPSGFTEAVDATTTTGNDQSIWVGYRIDTAPATVDFGSLVVTGGASAVSEAMLVTLAGGFQTATVTRSANGVSKAHSAGTLFALDHPLTQAL